MKAPPPMHAYVTADAQGDQCVIIVVFGPVMNYQAGVGATPLAAEAIAPDHALAPAAEKAQGMLAPVVTARQQPSRFSWTCLPQGQMQGELARPSPFCEKLQAFH
jgi:hypothetical protein